MLKILIVEDEDFERTALKFLVKKYFPVETYVIGEASNGKEALEQAILLKPDIILMDISMPIMDGLQSSEILKEENKDIEIIILTAYDQFEYAKRALKCGISDYLVKPFSDKDFKTAISIIVDKINIRNRTLLKQQQLNDNFDKAVPFIEKELINKIAFGEHLKLNEIEESIKLLDIKNNSACCILIGNQIDYTFKEESVHSIKNILGYIFKQVIGARFLGDMVFFLFDKDVENIVLSKKMDDLLQNIKAHFTENEHTEIVIAIGPVTREASKFNYSYNHAKSVLRKQSRSIDGLKPCHECLSTKNIDDEENIISGKIINEDLDGALNDVMKLLEEVSNPSININLDELKSSIKQFIIKIRSNILDFINEDEDNIIGDRIQNEMNNLNNINDISNYLKISIKGLVLDISNYKNTNNLTIVIRAKKFIDSNYMNDIRLEDVAKHVCISSYYFSRIFKKIEGVNYIQYLTKVRMEKAKELILEGHCSIKEIAIDVGFMDQNYFSRAFKKYTRESPREFSLKYKKY